MNNEFKKWMAEVDKICESHFGLDTSHFPDYSWFDEFDSGIEPQESFDEWLLVGDFSL